jgi:hypothetical protein
MKWFLTMLTFAIFGFNPCPSFADERTEKRSQPVENRPGRRERMTPAQRDAKRQELKQRLQKRISELRGRQTNATITPTERRELQRREQILKYFNKENYGHVRALQSLFTLPNEVFFPLVVFTGDAEFKSDLGPSVLKLKQLIPSLCAEHGDAFPVCVPRDSGP